MHQRKDSSDSKVIEDNTMAKQVPIRIRMVEEAIADASNICIENIRSRSRDKRFAEARMAVWFVAHDHMGFSYPAIGEIYGRDHTTVLSGVRKMRNSDGAKYIMEGIRKTCPDALIKPKTGEAKTVENWKF